MRLFKYLLLAVGTLVALVLVAIAIFVATFDPKAYVPRLQALVQEKYARTLTLKGDIHLKVFPKIGIELGQVALSEHGGSAGFAQLDTLQLYLALMPLLQRKAVVDEIHLKGLQATLIQHADGTTNFDDLRGKTKPGEPAPKPSAGTSAADFDVSGIRVETSGLTWRDEKSGDETSIEIQHFDTGRIADQQVTPVDVAIVLREAKSKLDAKLGATAKVRLDLKASHYTASDLDLHLTGSAAGLSALDLAVTSPQVDARLEEGKVDVAALGIKLSGQQGTKAIQATLAMALQAELADQRYHLGRLKGTVTVHAAGLPGGVLEAPLTGDASVDLKASRFDGELGLTLLDSAIKAKLGAAPLKAPLVTFDVQIDKLDLDRLMAEGHAAAGPAGPASAAAPQGEASASEKPIDLSALKSAHLRGKLAVGSLKVAHLQLSELTVGVNLQEGHLTLDPLNTRLYEGSLAGSASVVAEGNHFALRETASGIAIGPLMHDLMNKNPVDGHGTVALDVTTEGATVSALKHALAGTARFALLDGAINGINLAASFRKAKGVLTGGAASGDQAASASEKTDFSELGGSFVIRAGVAHNEDLSAKSPFLRLSGKGDIDIGNSTLDYLAQATVVADSSGQGGQDLKALQGLPIPVRLSGPFAAPQYHIEYASLLKGAAQAKVQAAIDQQKQALKGKLQDALSGKSADGKSPAPQDLLKGLLGK